MSYVGARYNFVLPFPRRSTDETKIEPIRRLFQWQSPCHFDWRGPGTNCVVWRRQFRRFTCLLGLFTSAFKFCAKYSLAVASWLVRSSPDRAVRVRALAGDIVLCSWARHFTLTVPLSTQVYKWVPANLMLGGNPAMDWHPIQGGVEILLVASCHGNRS